MNHVRCDECGKCYNGKTGNDNTTGVVIYTVVGALIGLLIFIIYMFARLD